MKTMDLLRKNRKKILTLAKKHGVKDVRVFGSVAREEDNKDSDIDLLINLAEKRETYGFLRFKRGVEELVGRNVDIVFESGIYHLIKDSILEDSRPI